MITIINIIFSSFSSLLGGATLLRNPLEIPMLNRTHFVFISLIFACACVSPPNPNAEAAGGHFLSTLTGSKDDPDYPKAEMFDRFVKGTLPEPDATALKKSCKQKNNGNLFCYAVLHIDHYTRQVKAREFKVPGEKKIPPAITPLFTKKGKVSNWTAVRKADVPNLLRGLMTLTPVELSRLKILALREKRCPNSIAVALAATLEDNLPDKVNLEDLAKLDEKSGNCARSNGSDREAYFARAGLFYFVKKNYRSALRAFKKGSTTEKAFVGRSLYWLYRTQVALGDKPASTLTLDYMKHRYPFAFHTVAAVSAAGQDPGEILNRPSPQSVKRSQNSYATNQLVQAVETLRRFDFESTADQVLDWAILNAQSAEPEVKLYLAELKKDNTDHSPKLQMMSDVLFKNPSWVAKPTLELYFPKLFFSAFDKNPASMDPYLLLAVARQESLLNPKAISPANAYGLLQIQPATGKRYGVATGNDLLDPAMNIQAGSQYLSELLQTLNGQVHYVLASYNAGTDRLSTWIRRYPTDESILFADLIPFRETRDYVANVLRNYYWYRRIYGQPPASNSKKVFDFDVKPKE